MSTRVILPFKTVRLEGQPLQTFQSNVKDVLDSAVDLLSKKENVSLLGNGIGLFADGTTLLPSISNKGDPNTGIYFPAEDTMGFVGRGVEVLRITVPTGLTDSVINSYGTLDASDKDTASVVLEGGLAVEKAVYIGGLLDIGGALNVTGVFTSPGLDDNASSEVLQLESVVDAVNQFQMTNSAVGGPIVLEAIGSDADIDINLNPKGAGIIELVHELHVNLDAAALAPGQDDALISVSVDRAQTSGGDINALDVSGTEGAAVIRALRAGIGVDPIHHDSGTFENMDSFLVLAVDQRAAAIDTGTNVQMFLANGDTITVGHATTFEEIEFQLAIVASGPGVKPTFEFSIAGPGWTPFTPVDGTNKMRASGVVSWDLSDISATWAQHGGEYKIRITRTQNVLGTPPTEDLIQIASETEYGWDKDGALTVATLELAGIPPGSPASNVLYKHPNAGGHFATPITVADTDAAIAGVL
ncbi:hypothetical protein LCGC14_1895950, partial [marine sediment metagenome]